MPINVYISNISNDIVMLSTPYNVLTYVLYASVKVTKEGEVLPFYQQELSVGADGGQDRLMFIWPTTIVHKIDRHSPLYALSAQDMLKERFEIVVMLGKQSDVADKSYEWLY